MELIKEGKEEEDLGKIFLNNVNKIPKKYRKT